MINRNTEERKMVHFPNPLADKAYLFLSLV